MHRAHIVGLLVISWLAAAPPPTGAEPLNADIAHALPGGERLALADPNPYPRYGYIPTLQYPLHAAALSDQPGVIARLIAAGASADMRDDLGRTPLMVAAAFGNVAAAEGLIAAGAELAARDTVHGNTALHFAALAGRTDAVRLLLARGALPGVSGNLGETPLHLAALYNHRAAIRLLVAAGAGIDSADNRGLTALQYAQLRGRFQAVALLRELGARIDTLADAVNAGDLTRVRALLRAGADPDTTTSGGTVLHLAAAIGHIAIAAALLDAGADIAAEGDPAGGQPLHTAALNDQANMAAFLIDRRAAIEARDAEGRTPLVVAAAFGSSGTGLRLLALGGDPHATDRTWGAGALHYAASSGDVTLATALLAAGADVNTRTGVARAAPIHLAAKRGKLAMISLLVANGSDLAPVDRAGSTPGRVAELNSSMAAKDLLRTLGAPR